MPSVPIELNAIVKRYGRGRPALDGLDLSIRAGERVTVLGPSGSGKTTLLRLIAGLETADGGTIRIGDLDMTRTPPHERGVAMVFQNPALYPHLNVRDNLTFGMRRRDESRGDRRRRAEEMAVALGLSSLLDRRPAELSGGERQRVALGRALAREPDVLLLDEPFASLDEPLRAELRAWLLEIHARFGTTLVHVTHDQNEALALGQKVALLREGRLIQFDTPREVHDRPAHRFVAEFVGTPGMNVLACEIVETGDGLEIRLAEASGNGPRIIVADRRVWPFPSVGARRLDLGFRPQNVMIEPLNSEGSKRPPKSLVIPGEVSALEYQGHSVLVKFRYSAGELAARVLPEVRLSPGQPVQASIELADVVFFDDLSGLRLKPDCQPATDAIA